MKRTPIQRPGKITKDNVHDHIEVYVYELNLMLRLARAYDIPVIIDIVDRGNYEEVLWRVPD